MINVIEEWKGAKYCLETGEMEDWSDILEVSNLGNLRYTDEYKATNTRLKRDRPYIGKSGNKRNNYQHFYVDRSGKPIRRRMHRLVMSTFNPLHGNTKKKMDVDHIDFNVLNNKLYNLRWMESGPSRRRRKTNCKDYELTKENN